MFKIKSFGKMMVASALLFAITGWIRFSFVQAESLGSFKVWIPMVSGGTGENGNSNPINEGVATYYYATGDGACLFGPSPNDMMVAAIDTANFDGSYLCGAYVHVTGPQGEVTVRIVDWCPDCQSSHIDLSVEAFGEIANLSQGIVPITWQIVSPDLAGPIAYHFKDGSNQWWTAVQIRNHRNPIAKFEYYNGSSWVNVARTDYNYFVEYSGMGPGPYTFRVTDVYGNVLVDSGIPHVENGTVNGSDQFPVGR